MAIIGKGEGAEADNGGQGRKQQGVPCLDELAAPLLLVSPVHPVRQLQAIGAPHGNYGDKHQGNDKVEAEPVKTFMPSMAITPPNIG